MKTNSLVFIFILVFFTPSANAAGVCDGIACTGKILNLYPNGDNGKIYVDIEGDKGLLNCNLDQGVYVVLKDIVDPEFETVS